ncbi:Wzz/FepE/Etk N-terminal domain-containing protein [Syntrophomonas curvata]
MNRINNQPEYNCEYDEIDLRDIFKTMGKWKYTIISVTLTCMFLSGIISLYFMAPVYEATTIVAPASVSPLGSPGNIAYIVTEDNYNNVTNSKKMSDNVDNIIKLTKVDVSRYSVILTSNEILQNTIAELGLKTTPIKLRGQISVEPQREMADVSRVTVSSDNPKLAASIANTLVSQTAAYLNRLNKRKMDDLSLNLENQLAAAQGDLDNALAGLKKYQAAKTSAPGSVQIEIELNRLQNEVNRRENIVNSLSSKILELKVLQSFDSVEDKVVVLSAAAVPEDPVKPNKKLNVAIAGVLGLMISVFGVFLVEYLKKEDN